LLQLRKTPRAFLCLALIVPDTHMPGYAERSCAMPVNASETAMPVLESHHSPIHVESVALTVRDLDRVTRFYRDVVGLTVLREAGNRVDLGNDGIVLMSLTGDPHAMPAPDGAPGLFHTAFLLPERRHLGQWLRKAVDNAWALEGMADHLVSEAFYLSDPEGNGIEIYRDRPRKEWTYDGDKVRMANARLPVPELLALAADDEPGKTYRLPRGARIGHVHLCVNGLEQAASVIDRQWGIPMMCNYPGATFFGSGGYHHHIATNIWRTQGDQRREAGQAGLATVTLAADAASRARLAKTWLATRESAMGLTTLDGLTFNLA
jgi:catechol 2,3-dioxygenase